MATVDGTINGSPFRAALEPDGQNGHWLKIDRKLSKAAGADAGEMVTLEIVPVAEEPEPTAPADLKKALAADPKPKALWLDITPVAPGLDPVDRLGQAGRDAHAPGRECLRDACRPEAARLLFRSIRVLQQRSWRSESGDLDYSSVE